MLSSFRRSLRMDPIRVNLSASGIGLSAGVKGARVSIGPRGTYVSLTAYGFQYRKKLDPERPGTPPHGSVGPSSAYPGDGAILTASVASLQQTSPDDITAEMQRSSTRTDLFPVYVAGAAFVLLVALVSLQGWAVLLLAMLLGGGALPAHRWNAERRTARLLYDVDDPAAMERFALASAVGEALGQSASVYHIYSAVHTLDQRRNAGASTLIQRTPTFAAHQAFAPIETNLDPWSIAAGPQQLLFLPDRLLVREGGRLAALPYEHIAAAASETRFIEEGAVPRDAQQIGTTWRYVCKDGTPDLRFRDNRQIPILRYGEVAISSAHGVRIVFQVSRPEAAFRAAHALNTLAELARRPLQAPQGSPTYPAAPATPSAPPAARPPEPQGRTACLQSRRRHRRSLRCPRAPPSRHAPRRALRCRRAARAPQR